MDTADVVAPAAAKPPATPVTILPAILINNDTSFEVFLSSCIPLLSSSNSNDDIFLNSGLSCIFSIQLLNILNEAKIFTSIFPSSSALSTALLLYVLNLFSALFCIFSASEM